MAQRIYRSGLSLLFTALLCLCLPVPALAATVDFTSGSFSYLVGNPAVAGGATGIGGTGSTPTNNANASGNTVNVTGGTITSGIYGGYHYGSTSAGANAGGNTVNVGPAFGGNSGSLFVAGGFARATASGSNAAALKNTVNIHGGSFREIFGGQSYSASGSSTADNNTVNFTGGTVQSIYGGIAYASSTARTASASGNHVIISGGTVTGATASPQSSYIYGGYTNNMTNGPSSAINNTVTILGAPNLANVTLYGGRISAAASGDAWSGNTLEIKTSGVTVRSLTNFQFLDFYVPGAAQPQDTLLFVSNTASIDGSTVHVRVSGKGSPLQYGDTITLLDAGNLSGTPTNANGVDLAVQGISRVYSFLVEVDAAGGRILATLLGVEEPGDGGQVDTQLTALGESRMASLALLTQGQDLLESRAIPHLRRLAPESGPVAFGVMGGNDMRYNTGSHVTLQSFTLLAGLGWNAALNQGKDGNLLLGAFLEAGSGEYDSHNGSPKACTVKGGGNTRHSGGGVLARYDAAPLHFLNISGGPYLEASLRAGQAATHFSSSDFLAASGNRASFNSSAAYYGAHAGLGYILDFTTSSSLDLYSKYLWARLDSDSVTIEGDRIRFESVHSHRWRSGARFSYTLNGNDDGEFGAGGGAGYGAGAGAGAGARLGAGGGAGYGAGAGATYGIGSGSGAGAGSGASYGTSSGVGLGAGAGSGTGAGPGLIIAPYIGAAHEYEFDSRARDACNGYGFDAPNVKGGTGIGELGLTLRAPAAGNLFLDLGLQGYTGKREGYGGSLQMKWEF